MDSGNGGGGDAFTRVLIAITVVFGLTTAGTMVKQRAAPERSPPPHMIERRSPHRRPRLLPRLLPKRPSTHPARSR